MSTYELKTRHGSVGDVDPVADRTLVERSQAGDPEAFAELYSWYSDRIVRLNPTTGQFVEYLLPRATNVRRVFVDNSTTPVTFWVGNNHGASIIKLEPLDEDGR